MHLQRQSKVSMHPEIVRYKASLDRLFVKADELERSKEVDDEFRAHFTWYLCVRTSGYVELSVKTILRQYMESIIEQEVFDSEQHVVSFVKIQLDRVLDPEQGLNPRRKRILSVLSNFNEEWRKSIEHEIEGELGNSLDSIVNNRNKITHGKDVTLTLNELRSYFCNAQKVLKLVNEKCNAIEASIDKN